MALPAAQFQTRHSKIKGALYGLLVGDAMGHPYEFLPIHAIPPKEQINMLPTKGYDNAFDNLLPGTWSSDGAQSLALLDSLLACNALNLDDFARKLLAWLDQGSYTPDGKAINCGITTRQALKKLREGVPPNQAGCFEDHANGNGALMRTLPLALWHQGDDAELIRLAIRQSLPTHAHPLSGVVCALYCLVARRLLHGKDLDWEDMIFTLTPQLGITEQEQLPRIFDVAQRYHPQGTSFVVDCFWSAIYALQGNDFADVVRTAIAMGNDTDTTASVAGGLAGIRFGYEGIPVDWIKQLRGRTLIEQALQQFSSRTMSR